MKAVSIFILFFSLCTLIVSCGHKAKTTVVKENWVAKDTTIEKRVAFIKKIIAVPYDSVYVTNYYRLSKFRSYPKINVCMKQTEINDLLMTLKNQDVYSFRYSMCFDPHLFFYFIKLGDTTARVEVCFECNMIWHKIYTTNETLYMQMSHKTMMEFNKYCNDYNLGFMRYNGKKIYSHKDSLAEYSEDSLAEQDELNYHADKLEKLKNEHERLIQDSLIGDSIQNARKPWWKKIF